MGDSHGTTRAGVTCPVCRSETVERLPLEDLDYRCLDCSASFSADGTRIVTDRTSETAEDNPFPDADTAG